jgi:hypothetical protein
MPTMFIHYSRNPARLKLLCHNQLRLDYDAPRGIAVPEPAALLERNEPGLSLQDLDKNEHRNDGRKDSYHHCISP